MAALGPPTELGIPTLHHTGDRLRLIKRDGLACHLCGKAMIMDLLDDWGISIEHIGPRSKGCTYRLDNLRLAHRWSNSHRRNDDAPPPGGPPSD